MRSVSLSPTPPKLPLSPLPCVGSNAASVAGLLARRLKFRRGTHNLAMDLPDEDRSFEGKIKKKKKKKEGKVEEDRRRREVREKKKKGKKRRRWWIL